MLLRQLILKEALALLSNPGLPSPLHTKLIPLVHQLGHHVDKSIIQQFWCKPNASGIF
jgi:hypothetical protein